MIDTDKNALYEKYKYINVTDFVCFLEDKTDLINETLRIDDLDLPTKVDDEVIKDYIKTIDDGLVKQEIKKLKLKIKEETDIAKKVILLEKLTNLKKKECK